MPWYEHLCHACQQEFEDLYSMKDPIPTLCPLCGIEGKIQRLISLTAPGKVELTGMELKSKLQSEGKAMARSMNENQFANLHGSDEQHNARVVANETLSQDLKAL